MTPTRGWFFYFSSGSWVYRAVKPGQLAPNRVMYNRDQLECWFRRGVGESDIGRWEESHDIPWEKPDKELQPLLLTIAKLEGIDL